jgi:hypothetical protein
VWDVEIEPEVAAWLTSLEASDFDDAHEAIERLSAAGNRLRMPLSRPLGGGLFELRFIAQGSARRITYWYADWRPGLIVLLTTFRKQRQVERREIVRARAALERCQAIHARRAGHD